MDINTIMRGDAVYVNGKCDKIPARAITGECDLVSTRKIITFPDNLLTRITEWRRGQPDLPGESEGIRRLIERGLEAQAETKKQEK